MRKSGLCIMTVCLMLVVLLCLSSTVSATNSVSTPPTTTIDETIYYQLDSVDDLYWFAEQVNSGNNAINGMVVNNIIAEGSITWTPIGYSTSNSFLGIFDGNGYVISGLRSNNVLASVGFFGYNNGTIKNVILINSSFSANTDGETYVGGICAQNISGIIFNSYSDGTYDARTSEGDSWHADAIVGGICGQNSGTIEYCSSSANVSAYTSSRDECAESCSGGICGINNGGAINKCYYYGKVNGDTASRWKGYSYVGGICGYNKNNGSIIQCCNVGTVYADAEGRGEGFGFASGGGICGVNYTNCSVNTCFNTGDIKTSSESSVSNEDGCSASYTAGIVARNSGIVNYCKNIGNLEAISTGLDSDAYKDSLTLGGGSVTTSKYTTTHFSDGTVCSALTYHCYNNGVCFLCGYECPNHQFGEYIVTIQPDCSNPGERYCICTVCGFRQTREIGIDATKHNYAATVTLPTCAEQGYTTYTCTACSDCYTGDYTNTIDHSYIDGVCSNCGDKKVLSSGSCGENITYALYETGQLVISGTGSMTNWSLSSHPGWYSLRELINEVQIEYGVVNIGAYAFAWCDNVESIDIPDSVALIGDCAFRECSKLRRIEIPDKVTDLGSGSFYHCYTLSYIKLPNSLSTIKESTFCNSGLQAIDIGTGVSSIGIFAFQECNYLEEIVIPGNVKTIGSSAFSLCSSLKKVTMGDGVTTINDAFWECENLETVIIPQSVISISSCTFSQCISLKKIIVDESNMYYSSDNQGALYDKSKKLLICVPGAGNVDYTVRAGVAIIDSYAFSGCADLRVVRIPNSVLTIRYSAFQKCVNLNHVLYYGSEQQQSNLKIDEYDMYLIGATWHANANDRMVSQKENCINNGLYCSMCCAFVTRLNLEDGTHNATQIPATAASCTNTGLTEGSKCSICTEILLEQQIIPAMGHSYTTQVTGATCIYQGYTTYTCQQCKDIYVDNYVPAQGHSWLDATCTTAQICTVCHSEQGEPLGHSGDIWIEIVAPTCTKSGIKARICNVCDVTESVEIPALGHSYESVVTAPTCTQRGYTTHTCGLCGDSYTDSYVDAKGHRWSAWIKTKVATCTEEGSQTRFCNCGTKETEKIEKQPHCFVNDICIVCGQKTVELKIASVTLRPETAGLYFTGNFEIAEDVEILRQGIVVSVYSSMPVADGSDETCLWSTGGTSVLVANILSAEKDTVENALCGTMPIYARAYVELEDGTIVYSDTVSVNLLAVVQSIDGIWSDLTDTQKAALKAMYAMYTPTMEKWALPNMKEEL